MLKNGREKPQSGSINPITKRAIKNGIPNILEQVPEYALQNAFVVGKQPNASSPKTQTDDWKVTPAKQNAALGISALNEWERGQNIF